MANQIFRQSSLDKLSSPEQLDQLMQITTPKGWVALLATGLLIGCVVVWGFLGSIPAKVSGQGILVKTGGVFEITTTSTGLIKGLYFAAGDRVKKGQVVARIEQNEILSQINEQRELLREQNKELNYISRFGTQKTKMERESVAQQRANIKNTIINLKKQQSLQKQNVKSQEILLKQGLITRTQLLGTKTTLSQTTRGIRDARNSLKKLDLQLVKQKETKRQNAALIKTNIAATKRKLVQLRINLDKSSKIVSPYSGRILEVVVDEGMIASQGTSIVLIELTGNQIKNLEAILYLPAGEGKKVKRGMKVQIAPSTVKQEEHGFIMGLVTSVSEYPSTSQSMMKTLKNETLVQQLSNQSAPLAIGVDLIPDSSNYSGYQWSSSKGPNIKINTGTLCQATISVSEQKPITMVIPWIKKHALGIGI